MSRTHNKRHLGFSLLEMMIALVILLGVMGIVMFAMMQMMKTQGTIGNRTEMHSSVRSATELLQQEIGQAGRVALPASVTLSAAVVSGAASASVSSTTGMYPGELLVIDTGDKEETVTTTAVSGTTVTA